MSRDSLLFGLELVFPAESYLGNQKCPGLWRLLHSEVTHLPA